MKKIWPLIAVVSLVFGCAYLVRAQQTEDALVSCNHGVLKLVAPRPVIEISVRFADVARVCRAGVV